MTAFVTIMVAAVLLMCGLVLDGGLALSERSHALGVAQEAARAGAQQLDLVEYRATGQVRLDPSAAQTAARAYLAAAGMDGTVTVTVTSTRVTVTATGRQRTQLLSAIGIGSITVSATASAEPRHGITAA